MPKPILAEFTQWVARRVQSPGHLIPSARLLFSLSQRQLRGGWGEGATKPQVTQLSTEVTTHPGLPRMVPVYTCGPSETMHSTLVCSHSDLSRAWGPHLLP